MRSAEERIGPVVVLRHESPIDRDNAPAIEAWVDDKLAQGERFLLVHCGKVSCFDSIGLESVLALTRQSASQGARFALTHLGQDCATTLRVTRLESAIEHYLSIEDAVRAMRGGG
jgi:anti-anti-sigma factor